MNKKQTYITDGERADCQKVANAFSELFDFEDLVILDAGRYGFVKLQYFKFPFGFDTIDSFYDSKSLFVDLWEKWLHTELLNLSADTPLAEMEYVDIFKCLPKEKQKELLERRRYFAEKTGVEGIQDKIAPDLWSEEFMKTIKTWRKDWEHFDWEQVCKKLYRAEEQRQEGNATQKPDLGITLDELKEYFEWIYDTNPELYFKTMISMVLVQAGISPNEADKLSNCPDLLKKALDELS